MTFKPLIFALLIGVAGCATQLDATQTQSGLKSSTQWVATSDEWKAEAKAVYAEAIEHISEISASRPAGSWAVIMDVDETVLNNVGYQIRIDQAGESYSGESWYAWTQEADATLVPGAKEFIEAVNAAGGHVALVTNRRDNEQLATELNLEKVGLTRSDDFQVLLTRARPEGDREKDTRFALVPDMLAAQGYPGVEIVAYIGDNVGDKPSEDGAWTFFCIDQGGMYGEPCAAVPGPGR